MGGGTVRRLNTIMETMINTNEWGLVAALREKIRHLVDDLIFSTHATKMVVDDQNVGRFAHTRCISNRRCKCPPPLCSQM